MEFSCFNGTRNCDYCGSCHSEFKARTSDEKRRIYNQALEDLLKEICIGCAYLKGLECTNKQGCPCAISQKEVAREIIKLRK